LLLTTFVQGIYNYMPETNHACRVYSVAAVLYLIFVLHVMIFREWNVFFTFTLALSVVCVQFPVCLCFCSLLISFFHYMLLRSCVSYFEMVPVSPIINGITFAVTFHMRWISVIRFLYFRIFSASFLITFLPPEIILLLLLLFSCDYWGLSSG
jgi:hypothetical protein